jgi:prophage tail gpP-like protein
MTQRGYTSADSLRRTFVFIEVANETFDWWQTYSITSDMLNGSDAFQMHAPAMPRDQESRGAQLEDLDARGLRKGMPVKVYVKTPDAPKPVLQYTGRLDDVEIEESKDGGGTVSVAGRDHMAAIVDSHIIPVGQFEKGTLGEVFMRLLTDTMPGQPAPFYAKSKVVINNDANRVLLTGKANTSGATKQFLLQQAKDIANTSTHPTAKRVARAVQHTVDQVKPHPGETVYAYLQRHAARFGLMIWGTADGSVVLGRPHYDQAPLYELRMRQGADGVANNVEKFHQRTSSKNRPSEVHVYGKSTNGDQYASKVHAIVKDDEIDTMGLWRPLTISDPNARNFEEAERRARREMSLRRQTGDVIHAIVRDHSSDQGVVYSTDTIASVVWDKRGIADDRYVVSRTFTRSRGQGTQTHLELIPKNSIALEGDEE